MYGFENQTCPGIGLVKSLKLEVRKPVSKSKLVLNFQPVIVELVHLIFLCI